MSKYSVVYFTKEQNYAIFSVLRLFTFKASYLKGCQRPVLKYIKNVMSLRAKF